MYKHLIAVFVACLIILIVMMRREELALMNGFWRADADYCREAEIDTLLLYISGSGHSRPGYILMKNADGIIINDPINLNLSLNVCMRPFIRDSCKLNAKIKWLIDDADATDTINGGKSDVDKTGVDKYDFFPTTQQILYYPKRGKIILYDNEQIYAVLYKDNIMSDIPAETNGDEKK